MHIKKGDIVKVITGGYKGKTGKVLKVLRKENRVIDVYKRQGYWASRSGFAKARFYPRKKKKGVNRYDNCLLYTSRCV